MEQQGKMWKNDEQADRYRGEVYFVQNKWQQIMNAVIKKKKGFSGYISKPKVSLTKMTFWSGKDCLFPLTNICKV